MSVLAEVSRQLGYDVLNGAPRSHDGSNHASDRHYSTLRTRAREAQAKHSHFAAEASKAYKSGNKAEASALSQNSKESQAEAERLNEEAASWIFRENNTDSAADEVDLHGLFVKEAIIALDARIQVCRQNNQPVLKAIVGKGLHSQTHIAKLRPAVMKHCNEQKIPNEIDHHNPGVVLIHLSKGAQQMPMQPKGYPQNYNQGYTQENYQQGHFSHAGYGQQNYNPQPSSNIWVQIFQTVRQCFN